MVFLMVFGLWVSGEPRKGKSKTPPEGGVWCSVDEGDPIPTGSDRDVLDLFDGLVNVLFLVFATHLRTGVNQGELCAIQGHPHLAEALDLNFYGLGAVVFTLLVRHADEAGEFVLGVNVFVL